MNKNKLTSALELMFITFGEKNEERMIAYGGLLEEYDEEIVCSRIKALILEMKVKDGFKAPLPGIGDILQGIVKTESEKTEEKWIEFSDRFRKTQGNNHRFLPIPPDVLTIKHIIGVGRIESAKEYDWVWIMKEVRKHWEDMMAGRIEIKEYETPYIKIEGSTIKSLPAERQQKNENGGNPFILLKKEFMDKQGNFKNVKL